MIKIGLCGLGRMGKEIASELPKYASLQFMGFYNSKNKIQDLEELCKESDIIIDFSVVEVLPTVLKYCALYNTKLVIGTTGVTQDHVDLLESFAIENSIFYSANMSLGISLMTNMAANATSILGSEFDIAITDFHHRGKKDAPSGTSLMLVNAIEEVLPQGKELQLVSIRAGGNYGDHEVIFASNDEIITLKHRALNRTIFALGALKAAQWIIDKPAGLYTMQNMLKK